MVVRGSPAGRKPASKKISVRLCCVTTRRRNLWTWGRLGRRRGSCAARLIAACPLRLGMPGFGRRVRSPLGLPPRRLPAADLAQTLRGLAVALVPTPRLILAAAPLAQADPRPRSTSSGRTAWPCLTLMAAHGRSFLPGTARGERANVLLGRLSIREDQHANQACAPVERLVKEQDRKDQDRERDFFRNSFQKETRQATDWPSPNARNWP